MKRTGDGWQCSQCGHNLQIDKSLAMETAMTLMGDDGPCSAKNMTFAQTAVYIRTLELRWMADQRRIHELERQARMASDGPFDDNQAWAQQDCTLPRSRSRRHQPALTQ